MAFIAMVIGFLLFGVVIYLTLFRTPYVFAELEDNPMAFYFKYKKGALWRRLGIVELFFLLAGLGFIAGGLVASFIAASTGSGS